LSLLPLHDYSRILKKKDQIKKSFRKMLRCRAKGTIVTVCPNPAKTDPVGHKIMTQWVKN